MSTQLDIDDACSPHPVAKSELAQLRAEITELRRLILDVAIPALEEAAERDAVFDGEADEELTSTIAQLQEAVK